MKYKIEIWQYHSIVEKYESEEITEILEWYKSKWNWVYEMCNCTFYIYENDEEMTFEEVDKYGFYD